MGPLRTSRYAITYFSSVGTSPLVGYSLLVRVPIFFLVCVCLNRRFSKNGGQLSTFFLLGIVSRASGAEARLVDPPELALYSLRSCGGLSPGLHIREKACSPR